MIDVLSGRIAVAGSVSGAVGDGLLDILAGATLTASGTINAIVTNAGTLNPGASPGTLNISGDYTQQSSGRLNIEIDGPAATQFDRVVVTGDAALDGTANLLLDAAFTPNPGDTFDVITSNARSGQFTTVTGTTINAQRFFTPVYTATNFDLLVSQVNLPPAVAAAIPDLTVNEDAPARLGYADLHAVFDDPNDPDNTLTYTITDNTPSGIVTPTINANGTLDLGFAADQNGTVQITVRATDPGSLFVETSFMVTVDAVNDAPEFTLAGNPPAVNEDAGDQTVAGFASNIRPGPVTAADETGQIPTFTVTVLSTTGNLAFTAAPALDLTTGALTYTAAADTNGTATVEVTLSDDGSGTPPNVNTSAAQTFTITVNAVNDAPQFTLAGNPPVVNEDAGTQTVAGFAGNIRPGPLTATDEAGQAPTFDVSVLSTTGNLAFSAGPALDPVSGALTYTTAADTNGTAQIEVTLHDDGSGIPPDVNTSPAQTFTIFVVPVNDVPEFTLAGNLAVSEDAGAQTAAGFVSGILAGPPTATDETNQSLAFTVTVLSTTGNLAFMADPSLDAATGTLTYTTAPDTNGTATIEVVLAETAIGGDDSLRMSAPQTFTLTVNAVNDAPQFTLAGNPPAVNEDAGPQTVANFAGNMQPGPLTATDEAGQSLTFDVTVLSTTGNLAFSVGPTLDPTTGTLTYTAAADTNGTATVQVMLRDDGSSTPPNVNTSAQTFTLTVDAVNDAPQFTLAGDVAVNEDAGPQSVANFAGSIRPGPLTATDEAGQTLTFDVVVLSTTGSLTFTAAPTLDPITGALMYTPGADTNGTAMIEVALRDGGNGVAPNVNRTAPQNFTLTVNAVNDAPQFTLAGNPPAVDEDAGPQSVANFAGNILPGPLTATDEAGQTPTVDVTVLSTTGNLAFSAGPDLDLSTGTLTYTAAADTNGTAAVEVTLRDDGSGTLPNVNTSTQTFTLTVNAVNDAPQFTLGGDPPTIDEDSGPQSVANFAGSILPGRLTATDEGGQMLAFDVTVLSTTGNLAFAAGPAIDPGTGTLTYTAAADTNGMASVEVTLRDDGSGTPPNVNTSTQTFTLTVNAVNDAPQFTLGGDPPMINEDAGPQSVADFAGSILPGPLTAADEAGQTLTFDIIVLSTTGNLAFTAGPALDPATGTLTYTTAPDANGTALVQVALRDDGSSTPPSLNTSSAQTFTLTVNAVNDAPQFALAGDPPPVDADAGPQNVANFITIARPGPATASDELDETLSVEVVVLSTTDNLAFAASPTIDLATGALSYTPAPGTHGTATVQVTLRDGGGGVTIQTFVLTINMAGGPGSVQFSSDSLTLSEDGGPALLTVTRTGGSAGTVTVEVVTSGGSATSGSDYTPVLLTLTFADGQTSQEAALPILDDQRVCEGTETVTLLLQNATGGASLGQPDTAVVNIVDNEQQFTDPTQCFVAQVYEDVLNRPVEPAGLAYWTAFIHRGEARTQGGLLAGLSTDERGAHVADLYRLYLNREPDQPSYFHFAQLLATGMRVEQVAQILLGSPEYFAGPGQGTVEGFLQVIYTDTLHRGLDESGRSEFSRRLSLGQQAGHIAILVLGSIEYRQGQSAAYARAQMVHEVEQSPEYRAKTVQELYQTYLGRPARPPELDGWLQLPVGQTTQAQLRAAILGSTEYFQSNAGNVNVYLNTLYREILNRPPDTIGRRQLADALASGVPRAQVVATLLGSEEFRELLVQNHYQRFLSRFPGPAGEAYWLSHLELETPGEWMLARIVGSEEFFRGLGT